MRLDQKRTPVLCQYGRFAFYASVLGMQSSSEWRNWSELLGRAVQPGRLEPLGSARGSGGDLQVSALGELMLVDVHAPPQKVNHTSADTDPSEQSAFIITAHVRGTTRIRQRSLSVNLEPGDIFVRDSTQPSQVHSSTPLHQVIVRIPTPVIDAAGVSWPGSAPLVSRTNPAASAATAYLSELAKSAPAIRGRMQQVIADNVIVLLSAALDYDRKDDNELKADVLYRRACSYILRRLSDSTITAQAVASHLHVSDRYLQKVFSRRDQSVARFIWEQRLQRCRADLLNPNLAHRRVIDIAFSWGFSDSGHFSRAFRKRYNIRPSDLRRLSSESS